MEELDSAEIERVMDVLSSRLREATDRLDKMDLHQKNLMPNEGYRLKRALEDKLAANEVPNVAFLLNIIMAQQVACKMGSQRLEGLAVTDERPNAEERLALKTLERLKAVLRRAEDVFEIEEHEAEKLEIEELEAGELEMEELDLELYSAEIARVMDVLSSGLREATDRLDKMDWDKKNLMLRERCRLKRALEDKLAANEVPNVAFLLKIIMVQCVVYEIIRKRVMRWCGGEKRSNEKGFLAVMALEELKDVLRGHVKTLERLKAVLRGHEVSAPRGKMRLALFQIPLEIFSVLSEHEKICCRRTTITARRRHGGARDGGD